MAYQSSPWAHRKYSVLMEKGTEMDMCHIFGNRAKAEDHIRYYKEEYDLVKIYSKNNVLSPEFIKELEEQNAAKRAQVSRLKVFEVEISMVAKEVKD